MERIWIKCWHSPIWIRKNIGNPNKKPRVPYQDSKAFTKWLDSTVGKPEDIDDVILIGMTVNCCILCLAQELFSRGYKVKILKEATDDYGGSASDKEYILQMIEKNRWANIISWKQLKDRIK